MIFLISLMEEEDRRRRRVLAAAPTSSAQKKTEQWSRDPGKLLRWVLTEALDDKGFASALVDSVARLAKDDPELSVQLRDGLKASRRGARGTPYWQDAALVRTYLSYKAQHNTSFDEILIPLANAYCVSPETMRGKLSRALKRVPPKKARQWFDSI